MQARVSAERIVMTCSTLGRRRPAPTDGGGRVRSGRGPRRPARRPRALLDSDAGLAQLARFAAAGVVATAVQVLLFLLLAPIGTLPANAVAWATSTALVNELHRRRTFRADGRVGRLAAQVEGGGLALLGLGLTSGGLAALPLVAPDAGSGVQALLVLGINAAVGLLRFLALRWAFFAHPRSA
jgi:putative flippase GtrA